MQLSTVKLIAEFLSHAIAVCPLQVGTSSCGDIS